MDDAGTTPLATVEYPEERLAFALGDGRVGVLSVCGRKVWSYDPCTLQSKPHTFGQCTVLGYEKALRPHLLLPPIKYGVMMPLNRGCRKVQHLTKCAQVTDTKPKRPSAGILDSGDVIATAVASWANFVIFGDANGAQMPGVLRLCTASLSRGFASGLRQAVGRSSGVACPVLHTLRSHTSPVLHKCRLLLNKKTSAKA